MNFKRALFISLIGHCFVLTPLGNLGMLFPNKKINEPQVNYCKIAPLKTETYKKLDAKKAAKAIKAAKIPNEQKSLRSAEPSQPKEKSQIIKKAKRPRMKKPREAPLPKNETVVPESIPGTTLPNTPEFVTYYQYIREEIRRFLKQNYTSIYEEGDVAVSFALNQAGELISIEILNAKSSNDSELRRLSYESIKSSSPFKPFPRGLSQEEISFNLSIIFKHQ